MKKQNLLMTKINIDNITAPQDGSKEWYFAGLLWRDCCPLVEMLKKRL